jgi:hypothetical protein
MSGQESVLDAQTNFALTSVDLWTDESSAVKTTADTNPFVEITFAQPIYVRSVFLIPNTVGLTLAEADAAYCSGLNVEVSDTDGVYTTCGTINACATSFAYKECNKNGNSVKLSRSCADNCQISYMMIGFLMECDCSRSSMEEAYVSARTY